MYKAKLCSFALAGIIGLTGISPMTALAADTNKESEVLSESNQKQNNNRAAFDERMQKARDKWDSLTTAQKEEVYGIIEDELQLEEKLMDKLVELGVLEKDDATMYKTYMQNKYSKIKESGEFPLFKQKDKTKQ